MVELETENIPLHLSKGWSMFGYTCIESVDVLGGFASISEKIEIVKDEWGLAYLPAWGFSAFETLEFGEGYQIKMMEEVTDFQFCSTITGYNTDLSVNQLYGSWSLHSIYDLNASTGEWEYQDLEDLGGNDIAIDAENIYLLDYDYTFGYNLLGNSNVLQIGGGEDGDDFVWIYSFGNEHIITGEEGDYLFIEETYYNVDGTIFSRYFVYLQP